MIDPSSSPTASKSLEFQQKLELSSLALPNVTHRSFASSRMMSTAVILSLSFVELSCFHISPFPSIADHVFNCLSRDTVTKYESSGAQAQSQMILACVRSAATGVKSVT